MKPLALIGMSGAGKTYWSERIAASGLRRYGCDSLIAEQLRPLLSRPDGTVMRMGEWMGLPSDLCYAEREQQYLGLESSVMEQILHEIHSASDVVIDTTGSVIYTGPSLLARLKELATIVYLDLPADIQAEKSRAYLSRPVAVLWQGHFLPHESERTEDAILRCYPHLIASRLAAYESLADVVIPHRRRSSDSFTVEDFLRSVPKLS